MDAANLEVFLELHRRKVPLDRDVILLAEAGEEGTTQYGIDFMVAQHWDKIECEYVLNEGGAIHESNGKVDYASVGTTEKVPRAMMLVARGSSGHASMPRLDNPIAHLGAAVGKLLAWQPPMRIVLGAAENCCAAAAETQTKRKIRKASVKAVTPANALVMAKLLKHSTFLLPGAQQTPQQDQLPDVIGIVIGDEQSLAKQ
jgi:acetylornithine deacetylase/succinyl-diaminopimelate desuccinylase-like protein